MARFMEIKSVNPNIRQDQLAKKLGCSSSSLQRHRNDKNKLSPYRISPNNTHKRRQKISNTTLDDFSNLEFDLKKPQMTSKSLK